MTNTIGTITTYDGDEHPYLRGHKVRVVAVLTRAAAPDFDPDRGGRVLHDDDEVEHAGGVTAHDRVEVQPWLEREQRWSFVTSDPRDRPRVLPPPLGDPLTQTRPVTTPGGPAAAPGTTAKEPDMTSTIRRTLESLSKLRLPELQARFAEIVGEPTRSPNKTFLLRRIGEALEARAREAAAAPQTDSPTTAPAKMRLPKLSVAELQAMYREVVGRETRSSDSAYLVWKLRQAQKGRVRVGPIERRASGEAADVKVLPLRMTAAEVETLDEAWRRLGFKSRTAMLKKAIADLLEAGRAT